MLFLKERLIKKIKTWALWCLAQGSRSTQLFDYRTDQMVMQGQRASGEMWGDYAENNQRC